MAARSTMSASSSSIQRQLPTVVTFRYQNQRKVVTLAASHEQAQVIAARSFPLLASVDPSWLQFSIAVRYRATGERKEFPIQPESWHYVTSKLVAYRCIDVRIVPPRSPEGTPSSLASSLLPDTPPRQHDPPFLFQRAPPPAGPHYYAQLPRVDDDDDDDNNNNNHDSALYDPESPVTPPPKYPGPPTSSGYGYGFNWGPSPSLRPSPLYAQSGMSSPYSTYGGGGVEDVTDRRSGPGPQHRGWSVNSVAFPTLSANASPARARSQLSRAMSLSTRQPTAPPSPVYSHAALPPMAASSGHQGQGQGLRLFSSIRRALPGGGLSAASRSWASDSVAAAAAAPSSSSSFSRWRMPSRPSGGRRLRRNSQPSTIAPDSDYEEEEEEDFSSSEVATRSGRSYVPSLI